MKHRIKHYILLAMSVFVFIGSFYLIYIQNIDGVYINQPATFFVDNQNFKTDKQVYQRGDIVSIFTSFCMNRTVTTLSTWRLINETVITFPTTPAHLLPKGCVKNKWVPIGGIPNYAVSGVHHLEGTSELKLNNLHSIYLYFRSQDFTVTP